MAKQPKQPLLHEIARLTGGADITRPLIDSLPLLQPQDSLLDSRTDAAALDLYLQVLDDWQVMSTLQQRRLAVTATEWEVLPGGKRLRDRKAKELIEATLNALRWDAITTGMHYGVFFGRAAAEVLWMRDGAHVVPEAIRVRDPRRFAWRPDGQLVLLTQQHPVDGEPLPARKFWSYQTAGWHDDDPYGIGLAHWAYWPVQFKRGTVKLWLTALDKYASPTAVGHFPPNASAADRTKLLRALEAIRSQAALILPEGMSAELLAASRTGGDDYHVANQYWDAAISKVIVGHSAAADATPGRLGGEDQAGDVRGDLVTADADLLCASANNSWVRWVVDWSYPGAAYPKIWRRTDEDEDLSHRAERETKIYSMGYRPTLAQIQETYDGEWEDVARDSAAHSAEDSAERREPGADDQPPEPQPDPRADLAAGDDAPDYPDTQTERLAAAAQPAIDGWISGVRAELERAITDGVELAAFRERLLALYPDLPDAPLTDILGEALAAATLAGMSEIDDEDTPDV